MMFRSLYILFILITLFSCSRKSTPPSATPGSVISQPVVVRDTATSRTATAKALPVPVSKDRYYQDAYAEIERMLRQNKDVSFKRAVFVTENAYFDNTMSYEHFDKQITTLRNLCNQIRKSRHLTYDYPDSERIQKFASIFLMMKDTLPVMLADSSIFLYFPYSYDFEDFAGNTDWSKMFVTKLLRTHSGNCHSLPFLYKIIAESMGEEAYLALAPNHIYIKHYSKKDGWFNTELTNGSFPIDAWLMASGYIHLSAVQNGIYMDTLSMQQSLALCLVDLAEGYQHKFGKDSTAFVLRCCNLATHYFSIYINALLLKAETEKGVFENYMKRNHLSYAKDALVNENARKLYEDFEGLYQKIYSLGYRKMPDKMYQDWLDELSVQKEKYQNKKIPTFK